MQQYLIFIPLGALLIGFILFIVMVLGEAMHNN